MIHIWTININMIEYANSNIEIKIKFENIQLND